jgi:hypothetical protein
VYRRLIPDATVLTWDEHRGAARVRVPDGVRAYFDAGAIEREKLQRQWYQLLAACPTISLNDAETAPSRWQVEGVIFDSRTPGTAHGSC